MEILYSLNRNKAKDPVWDEKSQTFLISAVIHANDEFYKNQGMEWNDGGFKNEFFLEPRSPVDVRTGISLQDYDENDLYGSSNIENLDVLETKLIDNELVFTIESSEKIKIKTGNQIFSLVIDREVGKSTEEKEDDWVNEITPDWDK